MSARFAGVLKALAAFVALSLLTGYLLTLPGATRIDEDKRPIAHFDEALRLRGVRGQILAITSAPGSSAAISADAARLDDATRSGLVLLGQTAPTVPGAVQWVDQGGGGASITLTLVPAGQVADVELRRGSDPQSLDLYFTAHGAALQIAAVVPYSAARQSDTVLHLGTQSIVQRGGGAIPITFVVAAGVPVSVRVPVTDQGGARFALGDPASGPGQPLALAALSIADSNGLRADYCGAAQGALLWWTHNLEKTNCVAVLHASQLVVGDGIGVDLSGTAFQSANGVVAPSPVVARIADNPVPAAFLTACYAAIAGWLFRALFSPAAKAPG